MTVKELAKNVRRGVKLLDKKIPNWRVLLRKHEGEFDFKNGDHCVLGTLEHYSGRMQVLKEKAGIYGPNGYTAAEGALKIEGREFGFDGYSESRDPNPVAGFNYAHQTTILDALWRAEFEK